MKIFANPWSRMWFGAVGVAFCIALASSPVARAQEVTARTLIDRAQIQDLITHYYYNFGREKQENFADFYAEDAELILGTRHFKGRDGVAKAYSRGGGGDRPKPYSFNVTIGNPLIVVHGNTASAQLIYTEFLIDKEGDAPHIRSQGREYATFVKVKGRWLYQTREIKGGTQPPEGWKE